MKALTEKILHYLVLVVVTILATGVMWWISSKDEANGLQAKQQVRKLSLVATPKAPVAIEPVKVETLEITSTYAGKIQAWETYQIGFEEPGRVLSLGQNQDGDPLDEGDRVTKGQVLAQLDDRVFRARKSEAAAQIEQATADLRRAEQIRAANPSALTESELQSLVTNLALARAQHEVSVKNLEDATLKAPVDATISKRMIKSGETVGAHQLVFELVENDNVLLVVDVPESQIRELETRMRAVENNRSSQQEGLDPEDRVFRSHVRLEGKDRFGNPWPPLSGEVHQIAEVADPRTGLFPVEIRLSNEERLLRPGMVSTADIVTARIPGYRIPEAAVIIRQRNAHIYTVEKEKAEMEMFYWSLGPTELHRARKVSLSQWIDQGEHFVLPAEEVDLDSVVVRGHLRLADSQLVRVVNLPPASPGDLPKGRPPERIDVAAEH